MIVRKCPLTSGYKCKTVGVFERFARIATTNNALTWAASYVVAIPSCQVFTMGDTVSVVIGPISFQCD